MEFKFTVHFQSHLYGVVTFLSITRLEIIGETVPVNCPILGQWVREIVRDDAHDYMYPGGVWDKILTINR